MENTMEFFVKLAVLLVSCITVITAMSTTPPMMESSTRETDAQTSPEMTSPQVTDTATHSMASEMSTGMAGVSGGATDGSGSTSGAGDSVSSTVGDSGVTSGGVDGGVTDAVTDGATDGAGGGATDGAGGGATDSQGGDATDGETGSTASVNNGATDMTEMNSTTALSEETLNNFCFKCSGNMEECGNVGGNSTECDVDGHCVLTRTSVNNVFTYGRLCGTGTCSNHNKASCTGNICTVCCTTDKCDINAFNASPKLVTNLLWLLMVALGTILSSL